MVIYEFVTPRRGLGCALMLHRFIVRQGRVIICKWQRGSSGLPEPARRNRPALVCGERGGIGTLLRFWRHVFWNPAWGEFISVPKGVIGMATTCEGWSRTVRSSHS